MLQALVDTDLCVKRVTQLDVRNWTNPNCWSQKVFMKAENLEKLTFISLLSDTYTYNIIIYFVKSFPPYWDFFPTR